ncbi:MAG: hypothetical protein KKD44_23365 [Proteobacteria bacterium]|nr:hypothetical protein [Pseudomonadota bacterium]
MSSYPDIHHLKLESCCVQTINRINKTKRIYLFIILLIVLFEGSALAKDSDVFLVVENKKAEDLQKVIDNFTDIKSDKKFDIYLNETTDHSASEHHAVICNLFVKYQTSYLNLNDCSLKSNEVEKTYSNIWVKELIRKFGIDYIENNIESIKDLILNIDWKNISTFCIDVEKEGLYAEIQFLITVREYFQYYLSFYESLDKKDKQIYEGKKKRLMRYLN